MVGNPSIISGKVGASAFMRGKERFSAPGNSLDSIMLFSAGNAGAVL
jgi:hypothetical protein